MKVITGAFALLGLGASLALPVSVLAKPKPKPVEIALTFDDLPAHSALPPGQTRMQVATTILAALREAGATSVTGFVNGVQEEREPASIGVLAAWRAAGHPLGNHTWSHMGLGEHGVAEFEADMIRNEPLLEQHMAGQDWRWLRYPYLHEGDTPEKRDAVRTFLAGRGYHVASVTLSFDDWAWNEPYARCAAQGDTAAIAALEASWMQAAQDSFAASRALSKIVNGGDIPYVLLMHEGAFDARMLPRLLAFYKDQGVRFVSLAAAERHPFYAKDRHPAVVPAALTLENAIKARGLTPPTKAFDVASLKTVCAG